MKFYAAKHKDNAVLEMSSSGGAFTAISDYILKEGGIIVAPTYDYSTNKLKYTIAHTTEERDLMRGSKYVQVEPIDFLNDLVPISYTKKILYIGTPCNIASASRYFTIKKANIENIFLIDIICHGVPSNKVWSDYLTERRINTVNRLEFKDKRYGWKKPYAYVQDKNGQRSIDDYVSIFYSTNVLRPSCGVCKFASTKRESDLTIGDFWGIEKEYPDMYDNKGVSLLIVSTEKGEKLFNEFKKDLNYIETDKEKSLQHNLISPTIISEKRDEFWNEYKKRGLIKASRKMFLDSDVRRFLRRAKFMIKWRLKNAKRTK